LDYFVNLFGDYEQKYQNSAQLCDWTAGVLPAGVVNLPAVDTAEQLAGFFTEGLAGYPWRRILETWPYGSINAGKLGIRGTQMAISYKACTWDEYYILMKVRG
jgi:hypothetical protein